MLGEQKFLGAFLMVSLSPLFSFLCCCAINKTKVALLESFEHEKDNKSFSNNLKGKVASQLSKFCFNVKPVLRYFFLTYVVSINPSDNFLYKCIHETTAGIIFSTVYYIVEASQENKQKENKKYMSHLRYEMISRILPYILRAIFSDSYLQSFILGFIKKLVKTMENNSEKDFKKISENVFSFCLKTSFNCFLNGLTMTYATALENYFWSSAIFYGITPISVPLSKFFDIKEILDIVPEIVYDMEDVNVLVM